MAFADKEVYTDDTDGYKKAADMVFRAHKRSKEALKPLREKKWPRDYKFYHNRHDLSMFAGDLADYPYPARVFIPAALQQVETAAPNLCESLLENDPLVRAIPTMTEQDVSSKEKYVRWAQKVEITLHNQITTDVDAEANLPLWIRDALIYGTTWLFIDWYRRKGTDWRRVPVDGDGNEVPRDDAVKWELTDFKDELLEDRVRVRAESIWNVFPDPDGEDVDDCRYIQRLLFPDIDTLWQWIEGTRQSKEWRVESKSDLDKLRGSVKEGDRWRQRMQADVDRRAREHGQGWTPKDEDERLIRLIDHWEPDWHIIVAGKEASGSGIAQHETSWTVLLIEHNPFKKLGVPFLTIRPTPLAGHLFGTGLIDMIADLVHHVNTLTNLRLTNLERCINQTWFVNTMSGLTAEKLISQPASIYNVDGLVPMDQIVRKEGWEIANNEQWREIDYVHQQINLTAANAMQQGTVQRGFNETARGINMLMEAGNAKFRLQVKMVGVSLRKLAEAILKVDQQFIDGARAERIAGLRGEPDWIEVFPDQLGRDYILRFDVSPEAANKGLRMQQIINATQIVGQWPEVNRAAIARQIFEDLELPRPERFLATQWNKAEWENDSFLRSGDMPAVNPSDPHQYHIAVHNGLSEVAQAAGNTAMGVLADHQKAHMAYITAGMRGPEVSAAPGGGAPGGGPPGAGGRGAPAPAMPARASPAEVPVLG